jgi:hypothetical protein
MSTWILLEQRQLVEGAGLDFRRGLTLRRLSQGVANSG